MAANRKTATLPRSPTHLPTPKPSHPSDPACRTALVTLERDAYSSGTQPKTATVHFDAPASAAVAVKKMDGIKMRSHTLRVELVGGDGGRGKAGKPY